MAAFDTVAKMVSHARVLLQDTIEVFRFPDADLVASLNAGLLEARRIRPDLFLTTSDNVPSYTAADSTVVDIDQQYRIALVYFMCGQAQLRDEEQTQDARASAFLQKFTSQLLGGQ